MDEESQRAHRESWADEPPPPVPAVGSPTSQWLERVAYCAPADHSTMLLSALAILLLTLAFIVSTIKFWYNEPLLILMYSAFMLFNAALYLRRRLLRHWPAGLISRHHLRPWLRRHRRRWLRRGLRYTAILLGASFVFSFVLYSFPPSSMPMPSSPLRVGVCLGLLALGEYVFYRLIVLHLDEEEEAMQMHVHAQM